MLELDLKVFVEIFHQPEFLKPQSTRERFLKAKQNSQ